MKKILIRADASNRTGAGHLMRSVALAQFFVEQGISACLLTVPWRKSICDYLQQQAFEVKFLNLSENQCGKAEDLNLLLHELKQGFDWVALDNYYFDCDYQRAIRRSGACLLFIDDRNDKTIEADILVNHVSQDQKQDIFTTSGIKKCLFGSEYTMLRQELTRFPKRQKYEFNHVLVTLGGSSQMDSLTKVLEAIGEIKDFNLHVKVLVGFSDRSEGLLQSLSKTDHKIEVCQPTLAIQELYDWAEIAVCAGGGTCWELCFFGIPGLVGALIDHQLAVTEILARAGIFKSIGWYNRSTKSQITEALQQLLGHPSELEVMRKKALQFIDGKGPERILDSIQEVESGKVCGR